MSLHPGEKLGTQQVPPPPELELELATELLATLLDTTLDATDDCALLTGPLDVEAEVDPLGPLPLPLPLPLGPGPWKVFPPP
jgi:hypothetical protein